MAKTIKLLADTEIDGMIATIERDNTRLQDKVHRTAVSILKIWHDAKDNQEAAMLAGERLTRLGNAVPYHRNAFFRWVALTGLHWAQENKTWFAHPKENRLMGKTFMLLRDKPFWEISPAPEAKPFVMAEELDKLIAKAQRHIKKPVEGDQTGAEMLDQLRAIKAKLEQADPLA